MFLTSEKVWMFDENILVSHVTTNISNTPEACPPETDFDYPGTSRLTLMVWEGLIRPILLLDCYYSIIVRTIRVKKIVLKLNIEKYLFIICF